MSTKFYIGSKNGVKIGLVVDKDQIILSFEPEQEQTKKNVFDVSSRFDTLFERAFCYNEKFFFKKVTGNADRGMDGAIHKQIGSKQEISPTDLIDFLRAIINVQDLSSSRERYQLIDIKSADSACSSFDEEVSEARKIQESKPSFGALAFSWVKTTIESVASSAFTLVAELDETLPEQEEPTSSLFDGNLNFFQRTAEQVYDEDFNNSSTYTHGH